MPVLYLASKSPRRREILAGMGISDSEVIHAGPSVLTAFEGVVFLFVEVRLRLRITPLLRVNGLLLRHSNFTITAPG